VITNSDFEFRAKKKESRLTPTFVNLKSNTMKNTFAKVRLFRKSPSVAL